MMRSLLSFGSIEWRILFYGVMFGFFHICDIEAFIFSCIRTTNVGRVVSFSDSRMSFRLHIENAKNRKNNDDDKSEIINPIEMEEYCDIYGCYETPKRSSKSRQKLTSSSSSSKTSFDTENYDPYDTKNMRRQARRLRRRLRVSLKQLMDAATNIGMDDLSLVNGANNVTSKYDNDSEEENTEINGSRKIIRMDGNSKPGLAEQLFDSMDQDNDGYLSLEEILSSKYGLTRDDLKALDRDQDGRISREELTSAVEKTSKTSNRQDLVEEIEDSLGDLEPLERQEMRLEGFEPYVLVSVLTAEGSFGMISEMNNIEWDYDDWMASGATVTEVIKSVDWLAIAVLISGAFTTIAGIYATTIFALSILYGKTAIGMDRDDAYYEFMDATGIQRFRAFRAFTVALLSFVTTVLLLVAERAIPPMRPPLGVISIAILYLGSREYNRIVAAALPIFIPNDTSTAEEDQ